MNNASGSTLQKVNFALLVLVLAALAYLIVRERARSEQRAAAETEAASADPKTPPVRNVNTPWPSDLKSSFAPLRARVETNVVRSVTRLTNRVPVVLRTNWPVETVTETQTDAAALTRAAINPPPPNGFIAGGGIARNGSSTSVSGHVTLRGTPPPEKVITFDATCGRLHAGPLTTRHYVVSAEGGLADTFVYIKSGAPPTAAAGTGPTLDQVGCEFQPYVLGVQVGQTLNVRNSDPILHNVHTLPKNPGNKERNVGQPTRAMTTPFVFNSPEVFVQFKCEVHPWMFAYVGVVDHPWFAVTDRNGNFSLPAGLPPGQYTLAAVHRKAGELLQQINVDENGVAPITFTFDISNVAGK